MMKYKEICEIKLKIQEEKGIEVNNIFSDLVKAIDA